MSEKGRGRDILFFCCDSSVLADSKGVNGSTVLWRILLEGHSDQLL